jgi:hypothetical protein
VRISSSAAAEVLECTAAKWIHATPAQPTLFRGGKIFTIQPFSRKCPIGHALDIPFENGTSSLRIYTTDKCWITSPQPRQVQLMRDGDRLRRTYLRQCEVPSRETLKTPTLASWSGIRASTRGVPGPAKPETPYQSLLACLLGVGAEVEWRVNQRLGKRSPQRRRRRGTPSRPAKGWKPGTKIQNS